MASFLTDNCYCAGDLTTERLHVSQYATIKNIKLDDLSIYDLNCDNIEVNNLVCNNELTTPSISTLDISANNINTNALSLSEQNITHWQDLIDNEYINIPSPPVPPTPSTNVIITEGTNVLYDDLHNSEGKIISSNPIFDKDEPYHYCKQTTWTSSTKNTYQYPIIEIQLPVGNESDVGYYNYNYHNYRMVPVKNDNADTFNIHDNSLYENIYSNHGNTYRYIHSDSETAINIDNSDGDFLGIIKLYNTNDQSVVYNVEVRTHSIYCNNEELAMPFNLTNVACYGYYKRVEVEAYQYEYYPTELTIVSTSSDNNEYWNIMVIKNGDIFFTYTIRDSDKPANTYEWNKDHYPCVFHFNNNNTLMVIIKTHYTDSNANGIVHFILNYTSSSASLTRYSSGSWDYYNTGSLYIGRRMRLKQYFDNDGFVVIADDWNYDADDGENDMSFEHYNGTYPIIEVVNPYNLSSQAPTHYRIQASTQTTIGHNFIVKGIISFKFSSDTTITGNDTWKYLLVYKCDDQNYDTYAWSTGSNDTLNITTGRTLPIYNNDARFAVIYHPEHPSSLINRLWLCYINWNCRSPYVMYCTSTPAGNPHGTYDSRSYFVTYYQLYNINNQTSSSSYILPSYLTNNKVLCSNNNIYSF